MNRAAHSSHAVGLQRAQDKPASSTERCGHQSFISETVFFFKYLVDVDECTFSIFKLKKIKSNGRKKKPC